MNENLCYAVQKAYMLENVKRDSDLMMLIHDAKLMNCVIFYGGVTSHKCVSSLLQRNKDIKTMKRSEK